MEKWRRILVGLVMLGVAWASYRYWDVSPMQRQGEVAWTPVEGTVDAPAFPTDLIWYNTTQPVTWDVLRGKIVLLYFWNYGQRDSAQLVAEVRELQDRFFDSLVVIGVHDAQYSTEAHPTALRDAVRRWDITFPVVQDTDKLIAKRYGVAQWPTLYIVDPRGRVLTKVLGSGTVRPLAELLKRMETHYRDAKQLSETPIAWPPETAAGTDVLRYPGNVLADLEQRQLYIADSGHHRILVASLSGDIQQIIGDGTAGYVEGNPDRARFRNPQGLARIDDTLYVADADNHAIRAITLTTGKVTTVAGLGLPADTEITDGPAMKRKLKSPWGLVAAQQQLWFTMAGTHQLWMLDLGMARISLVAGTGAMQRQDGLPAEASFAQPLGMTTDGSAFFVTDSLGNAVRRVPIDANQRVRSLVADDLQSTDQTGGISPLRYPAGIAYDSGRLFVVDTYQHRIVQVNLTNGSMGVLAGDGHVGRRNGPALASTWAEPRGVSAVGELVFVADTNNHQIRVINLSTGDVSTVNVQ